MALADTKACPERPVYRKELYKRGVKVLPDLALMSVTRNGNQLTATFRNDLTDDKTELTTDQVVIEYGTLPVDELFEELKASSVNAGVTDIDALLATTPQPFKNEGYQLHRAGDAVSSRSLHAALLDAFRISVAL